MHGLLFFGAGRQRDARLRKQIAQERAEASHGRVLRDRPFSVAASAGTSSADGPRRPVPATVRMRPCGSTTRRAWPDRSKM
jgi:hypothetical protein